VNLTADILWQNTWDQRHVTPARLKAVCVIQGRVKRFLESVLSFNLPGVPLEEMLSARRGLLDLFSL
jgi:hypothetical protein